MWAKSSFLKIAAVLTLMVFSVTSTGWARPIASAIAKGKPPIEMPLWEDITVPLDLGEISDHYQAPGDQPHVILIQDAHAIPDAQRSIWKLIGHFQSEYGINLIALEGASAALDSQIFRSFPDQKLLAKVFEEYMNEGELAGGPAASIFSAQTAHYHGIENWNLYEKGMRLYQEAATLGESFKAKINTLKSDLVDQKKKNYSKELYELDKLLQEFYENRAHLPSVLKELARVKAPKVESELSLLLEANTRKGDEESTVQEVKRIAESVHQHLKKISFSKEARGALKEFNEQYQDFSTSRLTPHAFALHLKKLVSKFQIPVRVSKRLERRTKNQQKLENIKGTKLFEEFEHYAAEVKNSLFRTDAQRQLDELSDRLRLIETLIRLELSHDQWVDVQELVEKGRQATRNRNDSDIDDLLKEAFKILRALVPHFQFYETADARDEAFLKNLQRLMKREDADQLIMVAGGFHAHNMARMFRENHISYLLLRPQMNSLPNETSYRRQMQGDVSWKEYFEIENGKINLYKAFVRATRDRLLNSSEAGSPILKEWRDQIIRDLAEQNRIADASKYTQFLDEVSVNRGAAFRLTKRLHLFC